MLADPGSQNGKRGQLCALAGIVTAASAQVPVASANALAAQLVAALADVEPVQLAALNTVRELLKHTDCCVWQRAAAQVPQAILPLLRGSIDVRLNALRVFKLFAKQQPEVRFSVACDGDCIVPTRY